MTISFNKIKNKPTKISKNEEAIWLRYNGSIYVSDNDGNPRLMVAGTQYGKEIPTWVPEEPNMLYYSTDQKMNYISGTDKWYEVPRKGEGSEGGPTTLAGNVILDDKGDNYSSTDVEGALKEIADKIKKVSGLTDYSGAQSAIRGNGDYFITQMATAKPTTSSLGWSSNRQGSNGKTYGFFANDTDIYHVVNGAYSRLLSQKDLEQINKDIKEALEKFNKENGLSNKTIITNQGIKSNGEPYTKDLTIGLADDVWAKIKNLDSNGSSFVKKTGDTMSGDLVIANSMDNDVTTSLGLGTHQGKVKGTFYFNRDTNNMGIWDTENMTAVLRHNINEGFTNVFAPKSTLGLYAPKGYIIGKSSNRNYLEVTGHDKTSVLELQSPKGGIRFGISANNAYIESYGGRNDKANKNMRFSAPGPELMERIRFDATFTYARKALVAGSSVHVGMDTETEYGHKGYNDMINSSLCIFPYERNGESNAERNYARLAYSQKHNVLRVQSYKKNTGKKDYTERVNSIGVEANWFKNTSSIEYKDIIGKVSPTEAFNEVMATTPYLYTFKDDNKEIKDINAGFIIEKGMPENTISQDRKSVDSYGLIAYMYGAFQEYVTVTNKRIKELEQAIRYK